jgi:hypothetical protein
MTPKQRIVLNVSLTLNVVFVGWVFSWFWLTSELGGGQGERSPDGKWMAGATSSSSEYTFDVGPQSESSFVKRPLRRVAITPTDHHGSFYFRELPKIIEWSPDSSKVTFSIPSVEVTLDVAESANLK